MAAPRKSTGKSNAKASNRGKRAAAGASRSTRQSTPERDSHGRFKADHHVRNAAFGATAALGAVAAGVAAAFKFGLLDRFLPRQEGHDAEDLLIDAADQRGTAYSTDAPRRAPKAFRPDIDAPMTAAEREALRPAEGHTPGFAADRGTTIV